MPVFGISLPHRTRVFKDFLSHYRKGLELTFNSFLDCRKVLIIVFQICFQIVSRKGLMSFSSDYRKVKGILYIISVFVVVVVVCLFLSFNDSSV